MQNLISFFVDFRVKHDSDSSSQLYLYSILQNTNCFKAALQKFMILMFVKYNIFMPYSHI